MKCPICDYENDPVAKRCKVCGKKLEEDENTVITDNPTTKPEEPKTLIVDDPIDKVNDIKQESSIPQPKPSQPAGKFEYTPNNYNLDSQPIQQAPPQTFTSNTLQGQPQQPPMSPQYQQQYNPNYNPTQPHSPINQKNKALAFILAFLIPGAGYCYVDEWGKGLVVFLVCLIMGALTTFFVATILLVLFGVISGAIYFIIWIFSLVDIFGEVDKYNRGEIR